MTKARELAELGTTLSVDGSGNADLAGSLATNGLTVNGAVALQSTTTGGHVVSGVTVDLAAEIKGVTGYGNLRVLFDPSTKDSYILGAYNGGDIHLSRRNASVNYKSLSIDASTGDISFYEDTGTTAKLFWDASAEALGIGTTSPSYYSGKLTVAGGNIAIEGGNRAIFWNTAGNGVASIQGVGTNELSFSTSNSYSERMRITSSGNVGIGTSSPAEGIHLARSNATALIESTDGTQATLDLKNTEGHFIIGNDGGSLFVFDQTDTAERFRIDTSGNVGIGTSAPVAPLEVVSATLDRNLVVRNSANNARFQIKTSGLNKNSEIWFGDADDDDIGRIDYDHNNDSLAFYTNTSERMRIDASGHLLVGTTSSTVYANSSATGIAVRGDGLLGISRDGNAAAVFNRNTSDGEIVQFRKDGTSVGRIGNNGANLVVQGTTGKSGVEFGSTALIPWYNGARSDNINNLGSVSSRYQNLYLSGGVYLGGTGSANLLDDYEEGTWTPTPAAGLTSISVYGANYVKVGNMVTLWLSCALTGDGTSTQVQIGGLPFYHVGGSAGRGDATPWIDYANYGSNLIPRASIFGGTTWISLYAAYTNSKVNQISIPGGALDTSEFNLTISYLV